MHIEIYYCGMWNYLPQASRLEEELKDDFPDTKISLIKDSGGTFLVKVDEEVLFSKLALPKEKRRFPEYKEISYKIKKLITNEEFWLFINLLS